MNGIRPTWRGVLCTLALRTLLATLAIAAVLAVPAGVRADGRQGIIFEGTFETGDLTGFYWHQNAPEAVSSASHPVRNGGYSMRCYLHRYDSKYSYRTEAIVGADPYAPPDTEEQLTLDNDGEYWIGFSSYLPSDFVPDIDRLSEVVFQMQASPDDGEDYRSPIFALEVNADEWRIFSRWDTRSDCGTENEFTGTALAYEAKLGPSIGNWTDWVIHVEFSYKSDGVLQVWRNGQLVVDRRGPNCSNDERGPHVAIGMYKWPWKDSSADANSDYRLIYHDEFRTGDASASYADVAPGGDVPVAVWPSPDSPQTEPVVFLPMLER